MQAFETKMLFPLIIKKNWIKELPFKVFFYVEAFQEETPTWLLFVQV